MRAPHNGEPFFYSQVLQLRVITPQCSKATTGLNGVQASREFKQELLIQRKGSICVVQPILMQVGQLKKGVVCEDIIKVQGNDLLQHHHGGIDIVFSQRHLSQLHQHFVFQRMSGPSGDQRIEFPACCVASKSAWAYSHIGSVMVSKA